MSEDFFTIVVIGLFLCYIFCKVFFSYVLNCVQLVLIVDLKPFELRFENKTKGCISDIYIYIYIALAKIMVHQGKIEIMIQTYI